MLADLEAYERPLLYCACGGPGTLTVSPLDARWGNPTGKNLVAVSLRKIKSSVNIPVSHASSGVINYLIRVINRGINSGTARKLEGRTWESTRIRSAIGAYFR